MLLWNRQPAEKWLDAMPLGNGLMGAMAFGGVREERISLNESSFWSGRPHDYNDPDAGKYFAQIRDLVFAGKFQEAERLADEHFYGVPKAQQAYQPFGDLLLNFDGVEKADDYRRELDMETGVAKVRYRAAGVVFTREVFVSYPHRVMVVAHHRRQAREDLGPGPLQESLAGTRRSQAGQAGDGRLLESSFDRNVYSFHSLALMGGLAGYTLVLSLAAFVVIRIGKVWDDGRSLLLLVVLMLLGTSISFDGALAKYPANGTLCSAGGLLFSVLLTEGLLRGLAIRLPVLFRVPYYLTLGLFFLYPVALRWAPFFSDPYDPGIQWALLAFPWLAAIVCLSLLPAVRRGQGYVRDSGTPWPWPWYPWTVFFMIGLGVCGRSYYLCLSMHMVGGFTTIFAPYFLVPFLLAANLLLLEGGLVAGSIAAQRIALLVPAGVLLLAMVPPSGKPGLQFVEAILLPTTGAGPLFSTTLAIIAFYGWAVARRVAHAVEALSAALVPKQANAEGALGHRFAAA